MLPLEPRALVALLDGTLDEVLIDRMNYTNKVKALYRREKLDAYLGEDYFRLYGGELKEAFQRKGVPVTVFF